MPEKSLGVSALLDLAADLMDEHGWRIGTFYSVPMEQAIDDEHNYVGGAMCTEGAIRAASSLIWADELRKDDRQLGQRRREVKSAYAAVAELIPAWENSDGSPVVDGSDGGSIYRIPWWNDSKCCSKAEAVGILRDAATKTRPDS